MRKSLFFAAFACVALASCVTDDVSENNQEVKSPQKITFNAPVVSGITRAVAGEQPDGTTNKYSTSERFRVYAMWSKNNYTTGNWDVNNLYMDGVEVAYGDATKNYWASEHFAGQNPYYWPEDGYLTFAAYSPADADGTISYSADGLTIEDFTVNDNCSDQYDLMYSIRSYNRTASINELTSGTGHTTNSYQGVDILFKHALSSIKFKVKTNEEYTGTTIKIKKIEILNVSNKGTFKENITDGPTYVSAPEWTVDYNSTNLKNYTAWDKTGGQTVSNGTAQDLEDISDIILLPQDMVNSIANKIIAIRVNYSIRSGSGNEIEQENTLYLNDSDNDGTGNDYYKDQNTNDIAAWEMGKRYTYTINFGLDKIFFSPEVTNWTDVNVTPDLAI